MFTQQKFCITDEEMEKIKEWADTHECIYRCGNRASTSCCGGEISITFTPTSIGTVKTASCACGSEIRLNNL